MRRVIILTVLLTVGFVAADEGDEFLCTRADEDAFNAASAKLPYNVTDIEEGLTRFCPLMFDNFTRTGSSDETLGSANLDWVVKDSSCNNDTCLGYLTDMTKILPGCAVDDIYPKGDYLFNLAICAHVRSTGTISKDVINNFYREISDIRNIQRVLDDALSKLEANTNIRTYAPTAVYRPIPLTPPPPSTKKYTPKATTATPAPSATSSKVGSTAGENTTTTRGNGTASSRSSGSGDFTPGTTEPSAPSTVPRTVPSPAPTSACTMWFMSSLVAFSGAFVVVAA